MESKSPAWIYWGLVWKPNMMKSSSGNIFRVTGHLCGEFTGPRSATRSFGVFFDLRLNKRLSKQSWGWWSETPSRPSWRHCYEQNKNKIIRVFYYIITYITSGDADHPCWTNFLEIWIKMQRFSSRKIYFRMLSAKCRPFSFDPIVWTVKSLVGLLNVIFEIFKMSVH